MDFEIGIRCVSILRYLAEFSEKLPLCVLSRMLSTHDVPYLLAQLIEKHPWKKLNEKGKSSSWYRRPCRRLKISISDETVIYNGKWESVRPNEEGKVSKVEGQVWIGLHELLLNPKSSPYYEMTEFRISALTRVLEQFVFQ